MPATVNPTETVQEKLAKLTNAALVRIGRCESRYGKVILNRELVKMARKHCSGAISATEFEHYLNHIIRLREGAFDKALPSDMDNVPGDPQGTILKTMEYLREAEERLPSASDASSQTPSGPPGTFFVEIAHDLMTLGLLSESPTLNGTAIEARATSVCDAFQASVMSTLYT